MELTFGCLSSSVNLNLGRNNFEHLRRSLDQLGAPQSLDLSDCKKFKELHVSWRCQTLLLNCMNLEEVYHFLRFFKKTTNCKCLKRFQLCALIGSEEVLQFSKFSRNPKQHVFGVKKWGTYKERGIYKSASRKSTSWEKFFYV